MNFGQILVAKGEQATALVEQTQAQQLMINAKRKYYKIMNEIKRVNDKRKASLDVKDAAEAKLAAVETEQKIAELMSESAAALASAHAEAGEKTINDETNKMELSKEEEESADSKKEELMSAVLTTLGEKLDADNQAKYVNSRAAIADGHAQAALEVAARHRDEAKDLLGSVNELARLAKQAAEVAAAERIKAQAEAIAQSAAVPCMVGIIACAHTAEAPVPLTTITNPTVHVHVLPNGM